MIVVVLIVVVLKKKRDWGSEFEVRGMFATTEPPTLGTYVLGPEALRLGTAR